MRRLTALLLVALCSLVAAPVAAQAASLVYLDPGNDVAVARPDGSLAHKVTHATDAAHGYKAISVADDGGITAYLSQGEGTATPASSSSVRTAASAAAPSCSRGPGSAAA